MDLFNLTKNLKNRVLTSIGLLLILLLMLINNFILGFFLIIIGVVSILEFYKINLIISKKKKLNQFIYNLIFTIYIFTFCAFFFILSSFLHLKILIFGILLICIASDIGGYVFGKIFKGAKLTKISPNKTIAGAIGSLIFSVIFAAILFFYLTQNFDFSIIITGLLTSIFCQLGDLFFSFLKRKSFLKDTGNLLPGHGGILDRVDGLLLGIPVGFLSLLFIY